MGTITLPNLRTTADVTMNTRLKDGGVSVDWAGLTDIKAWLYSDAQRAIAGRCDVSISEADSTKLVCEYSASKPQYPGVNRLIVQARYNGRTKTYDKPVFNFVPRTADQAGTQITMDDPEVDVEIVVEDVSSSILDNIIAAALDAAARAEAAAQEAEHMVDIKTGPAGKSPYKGENGNWFEWDEEAGQYVDTGVRAKGDTGDTPDISIGTVTTVEPGEPAAASMSGTPEAPVLNLSIPKGLVGDTPNFTIGTVTTGKPGTPVVVTITGTAEAPVLNITIPQGDQGNSGYQGAAGELQVVNNLTDGGATAALSAEMGKELDGKVSQLQHEVTDLDDALEMGGTIEPEVELDGLYYINNSGNKVAIAETAASVCVLSKPIPVKKGEVVNVTTKLATNRCVIAWTDDGFSFTVGVLSTDANHYTQYTATSAKNQYFVVCESGTSFSENLQVSIVSNDSQRLERIENQLANGNGAKYFGVMGGGAMNSSENGRAKTMSTSVELYIKITEIVGNGNIIGTSSNDMFNVIQSAPSSSVNNIVLRGLSMTPSGDYTFHSIPVKVGEYHHIVMTYDHQNLVKKWYFDGKLVFTKNGNSFSALNDSLGYQAILTRRIWGRPLSADEVLYLYNYGNPIEAKLTDGLKNGLLSNCSVSGIEDEGWKDGDTLIPYADTSLVSFLETPPVNVDKELAELSAMKPEVEKCASAFRDEIFPQFEPISVTHGGHDCTFIEGDFLSFGYDDPSQGGSARYINPSTWELILRIYHNFQESTGKALQFKSVDYKFGKMLVGNGRAIASDESSYTDQGANIYVFYEPGTWKNASFDASHRLGFSNCGEYKKIDVSSLGYKVYAFWSQRDDSIFVSCNLFNDIYLIKLGKGANNMGNGTYEEADAGKYNGSFLIVGHWHQDGAMGELAGHGGQLYGDSLYIAVNDTKCCKILRCVLCASGDLKFDVMMLNEYSETATSLSATHSYKYEYIDGLAIKDGELFAQPLVHGGSYVYDTILKAKI